MWQVEDLQGGVTDAEKSLLLLLLFMEVGADRRGGGGGGAVHCTVTSLPSLMTTFTLVGFVRNLRIYF